MGLIKEFAEEIREEEKSAKDTERWSISQHWIGTADAGRAWMGWYSLSLEATCSKRL